MKKNSKLSLFITKSFKILSVFLLTFFILNITSCIIPGLDNIIPSKPSTQTDTQKPAPEEPAKPSTPAVVEKPAPEVPKNVIFAQKLQEELNKGNVKGAIALFDNMPKELKDDQDLKLLLASLYISDHDYENATITAKNLLEKNSKNIDAMEIVALSAKATKDTATYKEYSNKILTQDPNNPTMNIILAENYMVDKKFKTASGYYKKVLEKYPDDPDALYGYGLCLYYLDDVKNSKVIAEKLLAKNPDDSQALSLMAKLFADQTIYSKAVEYQEKAVKLDPNNYNYLLELGLYYQNTNKQEKAIKAWNQAIAIDNTYFLPYAYLAGSYDDSEDFAKAIKNYEMVIKTNPQYYFAYESIAVLEFHEGNYARAIQYFTKAAEYSDNFSYKLMIGACYYKLKDSVNAKKVLSQAMKKMDRESIEYNIVRFYNDNYTKNAENQLVQMINKEENRNTKGKVLYYMGLYYDIYGGDTMAKEYYAKVTKMQAPLFFEYRLAEWGLK